VGSQVGVMTSPWNGISPKLVTRPLEMIGRRTQLVDALGGIAHPVATAPPGPTSVSLHSVEPGSYTQLWPPAVSGCAGSLCSLTDESGMNSEPAGSVKDTFGDQLLA